MKAQANRIRSMSRELEMLRGALQDSRFKVIGGDVVLRKIAIDMLRDDEASSSSPASSFKKKSLDTPSRLKHFVGPSEDITTPLTNETDSPRLVYTPIPGDEVDQAVANFTNSRYSMK